MTTVSQIRDRRERNWKAAGEFMWHVGAFVILNGFFWILDWSLSGRFSWAYWVTLFWAVALAFHALAAAIRIWRDRP